MHSHFHIRKSCIIRLVLAENFRTFQFYIFHCTQVKSNTNIKSFKNTSATQIGISLKYCVSLGNFTILSLYSSSDTMISEVISVLASILPSPYLLSGTQHEASETFVA